MQRRRLVTGSWLFLFAVLAGACTDPVHDDAVEALGEEKRGVRPGPNHRPGQPCLTCHGEEGPASPEFSVAGTVYLARGVLEPVPGVKVYVEDATGGHREPSTNEVGNFYVGKSDWSPVFPLTITLKDPRADENSEKRMQTKAPRTGGCATCHFGDTGAPDHMPAVFLREKAL